MLKTHRNEKYIIAARSAAVTFVLLFCSFAAVVFMGHAYKNIQMTAFGNDVSFFDIKEKDVYVFFGNEFYFPVVSKAQTVWGNVRLYSSGIIKLLYGVISTVKESVPYLLEFIERYIAY